MKTMKIKFDLDKIILSMMLLQIIAIRWFDLSAKYSYFMLVVLLFHVVVHLKRYCRMGFIPIFLIFFVAYPITNAFIFEYDNTLLLRNFKILIINCLSLAFISYCGRFKLQETMEWLDSKVYILNTFYVINIPIIIGEVNGNYKLSSINTDILNKYFFPDLGSGLFGANGTPILGLFVAFVFSYNMRIWEKIRSSQKKKMLYIYNIFMLIIMAILFVFNDNKGAYITIVLFFAVYLYFKRVLISKNIRTRLKKTFNYVAMAIIICVVLLIILQLIPHFKTVINGITFVIMQGLQLKESSGGGSERIGAIIFFLGNSSRIVSGYGLGRYEWMQAGAFGFRHFGQTDLMSFLYLGGIILVCFVFAYIVKCLKILNGKYVSGIFLLLGLYFYIMAYTQLFIDYSAMFIVNYFCLLCCAAMNYRKNIKEGE